MGCRMIAAITWSQVELQGLLEDEESHVYFERTKKHLGLHPFHLSDLNAALRQILTSTLNKYDTKSKGIILSYKNPKLLTKMGTVVYDACFIHIDIEADFYMFRPDVGDTLKGIVNKKSEDHVGILVHKTFNVTIPRPNSDENWPGRSIQIGQEVRFTITYLDFKGRLPYIRGSMNVEDYLRGCKPFVEVKSNKTKFTFDENEEVEEALNDGLVEDSRIEEKVPVKKSKKVVREKEDDGSRKSKKYKMESEVVEDDDTGEEYSERKPKKLKSENSEDKVTGKKKKKSRVKVEHFVAETEYDGFEERQGDLEEEIVPRKSKKLRRKSNVEDEGRSSSKTKSKAKVEVEILNSDGDSDFHESTKRDREMKDESVQERIKKRPKIKVEILSSEAEESDAIESKRSKQMKVEANEESSRKKHKVKAEVLSETESVANEVFHVKKLSGEKSKKKHRIKAEVLTPETYD